MERKGVVNALTLHLPNIVRTHLHMLLILRCYARCVQNWISSLVNTGCVSHLPNGVTEHIVLCTIITSHPIVQPIHRLPILAHHALTPPRQCLRRVHHLPIVVRERFLAEQEIRGEDEDGDDGEEGESEGLSLADIAGHCLGCGAD